MIGADDEQERHRARTTEPPDLRAPLREPVREVDDERELRELGRVDRRQRPELEPARRAADHDARADGTNTSTRRRATTMYIGTDASRR